MSVLGDRKPSNLMDAYWLFALLVNKYPLFFLMSFSAEYLGTCVDTFTNVLTKILGNSHNKQIWCGQLNLDGLFSKFLLENFFLK